MTKNEKINVKINEENIKKNIENNDFNQKELFNEINDYFWREIEVEIINDNWKEKKEFLFINNNLIEILFTKDQLIFD